MPHRLLHRCVVAYPLLACLVVGCARWQPETGSPAAIVGRHPTAVRVETRNGSVVELVRTEVVGDTLTGLEAGSAPGGAPLRRVAIPVEQIERIGSKRGDARRIVAAALAAPLAYVAGGFLMGW